MNKEDYIKIKNNQTLLYILTCAYKGHYLVGVSNYNAQVLKDIYERTFPQKPKPSTNCGQCVYDFCYELGKAYFNYSEQPLMPTVEELKAEILEEYNKPEEPEPKVSEEEMKEVYDSVKAVDDEIDLTEKGSKKKAGKKSKK